MHGLVDGTGVGMTDRAVANGRIPAEVSIILRHLGAHSEILRRVG